AITAQILNGQVCCRSALDPDAHRLLCLDKVTALPVCNISPGHFISVQEHLAITCRSDHSKGDIAKASAKSGGISPQTKLMRGHVQSQFSSITYINGIVTGLTSADRESDSS